MSDPSHTVIEVRCEHDHCREINTVTHLEHAPDDPQTKAVRKAMDTLTTEHTEATDHSCSIRQESGSPADMETLYHRLASETTTADTTYESTSTIGDVLAFSVTADTTLTVTTTEGGTYDLRVREPPEADPTDVGTVLETVCGVPDDPTAIVALYARVTEIMDMDIEYDVYAVHLDDDGDTTDLGAITTLTITD